MGDRATVVAGVGTNYTAHSVELAEQAAKIGADGLLLVTPYYNKPGQAGVLHHFTAVADATDLPVMLYDVPGRTGTQIALETFEAAERLDTVVAVKDAVGDFARGVQADRARLRRLLRRRRQQPRPGSRTARSGSSPSSATSPATQTKAMVDAFRAGDLAEALTIFTRLLPAIDAVMGVPNYGAITAKAALQLLGVLDNRNVRAPLVPLTDDEVAALRAGLAASGLL